jgi:hypothetical protein
VQPVHALLTQKPLAALAAQPVLSKHSTHAPAEEPLVAHSGFVPLQALAPAFWQPVHALLTQNPFAASFVHVVLSTHSTHWPEDAPEVAHTIPLAQSAAVQPVQALFTQKPLAGLAAQPVLSTQSTHWPADVPLVAHTGLVPLQAAVPAFWQPMQALFTQKPFAGFFAQPPLSTHSTHWPAAAPEVAHTEDVPPSTPPPQSAVVQPVQALFTQKPLAGFFVHSPSLRHSTHLPADGPDVAQTASVEQSPAVHPVHTPATQKPLLGSMQSPFTPHVPAASGTRVSAPTSGPD